MSILFKRFFLTIIIVAILFVIAVNILIPATLTIHNTTLINCNITAANRTINTGWKNIFYRSSDTAFYIDNYSYKIVEPVYNGSHINIITGGHTYQSNLVLLPISSDTSLLQWDATVTVSWNPITKIITYFKVKSLQENMSKTIKQFETFLNKTSHVYGYNIVYSTLTDTLLISTKTTSKSYPSTNDIYLLINKLRDYIVYNNAKETNFPMLNVSRVNDNYVTMIGIPINKTVLPKKDIEVKRLIPIKDKILTTEVKGGTGEVKKAYQKIELYMQDHSLSGPVLPYELIITDRSKEPDSTKWVTKIIYPVA